MLVASAVGTKHTDISEHDYDLINLDNSDHEQVTKEGDNVDEAEIAAIQKSDDTSTLSLHDSFEILNEESELPSGEAKVADKDTCRISNDDIFGDSEIVDKIFKEGVSLNKPAHSKAHGTLKNAPGKSNNM